MELEADKNSNVDAKNSNSVAEAIGSLSENRNISNFGPQSTDELSENLGNADSSLPPSESDHSKTQGI